jgi:hypothetical protein
MPMNPIVVELDPGDERDMYWDVVNDTIVSAAWSSIKKEDATINLTLGTPVNTSTRTTCRVSDIELGALHELIVTITMTSGQIIQRSRHIKGVNL